MPKTNAPHGCSRAESQSIGIVGTGGTSGINEAKDTWKSMWQRPRYQQPSSLSDSCCFSAAALHFVILYLTWEEYIEREREITFAILLYRTSAKTGGEPVRGCGGQGRVYVPEFGDIRRQGCLSMAREHRLSISLFQADATGIIAYELML